MLGVVIQIGSFFKAPTSWLPFTLQDTGPPWSPLQTLARLNAQGGDLDSSVLHL